MKVVAVFAVTALVMSAGCTIEMRVRKMFVDGQVYYVARCSRRSGCISDANATCPRGYTKHESESTERELFFRCKTSSDW